MEIDRITGPPLIIETYSIEEEDRFRIGRREE